MALAFTASQRWVNHGAGSSIASLDTQTWLFIGVPRNTVDTVNRRLMYKTQAQMFVGNAEGGGGIGQVRYFRARATTDSNVTTNNGAISLNTPVAIAFIDGDGVTPRIYLGDPRGPLSEAGSYFSQITGSGAPTSEASNNLIMGGRDGANVHSDFELSFVAIFNRVLSLDEINIQIASPWAPVVNGCVLFCQYGLWQGTGTQLDLSGRGNHGTPNNGTLVEHLPLRLRRSFVPVILPPAGGATLTVQSATHGQAADAPTLSQAHTLAPADAAHGHAAESPTISQAYTLAADDAAHTHTAEAPSLTQAHVVAAADALHAHVADSPALTQAHALTAEDATHAHAAESPTLVVAGLLSVANALHAHTADAPALTQAHVLAAHDALHAHVADATTLAFGAILAPAGAVHAHTAGSPTLAIAFTLAPHDAHHGHTVTSPLLSVGYALLVQDAWHAHLADRLSWVPLVPFALTTQLVPALLLGTDIRTALRLDAATERRLHLDTRLIPEE